MEAQTKKVLICGDSFAQDDPKYPGLHFSQKIANSFPIIDWKVYNLATGGSSNRAIAQQMLQGMMWEPDFVILVFTTPERVETEKSFSSLPRSLNPNDLLNWNRNQFDVNANSVQFIRCESGETKMVDDNVIYIQNLMTAAFCLTYLKNKNIRYCWTEGGLTRPSHLWEASSRSGIDISKIFEKYYMVNPFDDHVLEKLPINLWDHFDGTCMDPFFHIKDDKVQESFANMCLNHILDRLDV